MRPTNVLTYMYEVGELQKGYMCKPHFVDLHTSNKCNHACHGCAYSNKLDTEIMSQKDHFKIVEDLMDLGVNAFDFAGGGEPLMLPYINELWEYIAERGCSFGLITNGSLLTSQHITTLVKHATYVRLSFEASNPIAYSNYKNVKFSMWNTLLSNTRTLIGERNASAGKLQIGIKMAVGKTLNGLKHFNDARDLMENLGADFLTFKALRHEPEELSLEEKIKADGLLKQASKPNERVWIVPEADENIPQCWLNPLHTVVDYLGNVYLCCYYYCRDNHCIGNMLKTPIQDLWFSKKHHDMVQAINKEDCRKVDCKFFAHHKVVDNVQEFYFL